MQEADYQKKLTYRLHCMQALEKMRFVGRKNFEAFVSKLSSELFSFQKQKVKEEVNLKGQCFVNLKKFCQKASKLSAGVFGFMCHLFKYFRQAKNLYRYKACVVMLIAISSKRIALKKNHALRKQIVSICRPLGSNKLPHAIRNKIIADEVLMLCDPSPFSTYWGMDEQLKAENIYIIDAGFLLFFRVFVFVLKPSWTDIKLILSKKFFRGIANNLNEQLSYSSFHKMRFFDSAFDFLLQGYQKINALFTTSNNYLTEILRVNLLSSSNCDFLVEMVHGVPSKEVNDYLKAMLCVEVNKNKYKFVSDKQKFIPLIPKPDLPTEMHNRLLASNDLAVNIYFNRFVDRLTNEHCTLQDKIRELTDVIGASSKKPKPMIIAFLGGTNFSGDFFSSEMFRLEQEIIERLLRSLEGLLSSYVLLYSAHPAHEITRFSEQDIFSSEHLYFTDHTITAWFVSHGAISLYSSALFEMAYLGVETYSPIIPRDNLFFDHQLALIMQHDCNENSTLDRQLNEFIERSGKNHKQNLNEQIDSRLDLVGISSTDNTKESASCRPESLVVSD